MIITAEHAGFCFGVKRAAEQVEKLMNGSGKIYTAGKLIHNQNYIDHVRSAGVKALSEDEINDVIADTGKKRTIVIRAHGIKKELLRSLYEATENDPSLQIVDCTCPFVSKIHNIMDENTSDETFTLLFGKKTHPEVIGTASHIRGEYAILESSDELEQLINDGFVEKYGKKRIITASQTTLNSKDFEKCKKIIECIFAGICF